ncbi:MAG: hypothetical protein J5802_14035 [Butyrivibrio sp.]|nr:hypothetical protein [Butyrivibrio sp.]
MDKRIRDFLRHLDKLELDALSEEELRTERDDIELHINVLYQEMLFCILISVALLICSSVLLGAFFVCKSVICFSCAAVLAIFTVVTASGYRKNREIMNKLYIFVDKISQMY